MRCCHFLCQLRHVFLLVIETAWTSFMLYFGSESSQLYKFHKQSSCTCPLFMSSGELFLLWLPSFNSSSAIFGIIGYLTSIVLFLLLDVTSGWDQTFLGNINRSTTKSLLGASIPLPMSLLVLLFLYPCLFCLFWFWFPNVWFIWLQCTRSEKEDK